MRTNTPGHETRWTMYAAAAAALFYVGCGGIGGEPVEHEQSQQHLEDSSETMSDRVSSSTEFLEGSDLLSYSYETTYSTDCATGSTGGSAHAPEDEPTSCEPQGTDQFNFDDHIQRTVDQVLAELREHVFKKDNIVEESRTSVTYAVEGEDVCTKSRNCIDDADGGRTCEEQVTEAYEQCKQNVNALEIRVRVTRPEANTYKYAIQVAPERYEPMSFTIGKTTLAATASLGDIKRSAEHYDDVYDTRTATELPSTMQGRIRAALSSDRPKHSHFEIKIEKAVDISGNDYDVALAQAAKPVFGITADGRAETLTTTLDFNEIRASWPVRHWKDDYARTPETDSSSEEPKVKKLKYELNLPGVSAQSTFEAGSEEIEFTDISLGNATSWLKIDGKKAVTVDLNPQDGRVFGATLGVHRNNDGTVEAFTLDVRPTFDLTTDFDFTHVSNWVHVDDWLENYSFQTLLDGANPASLLLNQEHLKVTAGQLELSSTSPNASRKVQTNQCLEYVAPEPATCDSSTNSTCDSDGSERDPYHPLRDLEVTDCSGN